MKALLVVLALFLPIINAQVPHWGPCPEPFMGRWFEIAKLPAQFERGRCIETNFTLRLDGTAHVLKTIDRIAVVEDKRNPAKLGISFSYGTNLIFFFQMPSLVYSCTDVFRLFHVDFAWILGRTRSLPAATIDHGKEVFTNNNIDVSRMILSRQQGCDRDL
uniref:Apolipoprotein Da, duplicate 1 n=1 Tax=Sinocyclocheilus rhinocerous TaxID=307959 RepID=A0A673KVW2_9TELE